jgi:hypothetical protein
MGVMYTGVWRRCGWQYAHAMSSLRRKALKHTLVNHILAVCKEKVAYGYRFITFRMLVDWLQLWLLVVHTPQFDMPSNQLWWRIVSVIGLNQFMAGRVSGGLIIDCSTHSHQIKNPDCQSIL